MFDAIILVALITSVFMIGVGAIIGLLNVRTRYNTNRINTASGLMFGGFALLVILFFVTGAVK